MHLKREVQVDREGMVDRLQKMLRGTKALEGW